MLPPIWNPPYKEEDLRHIAGFVAHTRERILNAIKSLESGAADEAPDWRDSMIAHWSNGEQWTRWMLYNLGYKVKKGKRWGEKGGAQDDRP